MAMCDRFSDRSGYGRTHEEVDRWEDRSVRAYRVVFRQLANGALHDKEAAEAWLADGDAGFLADLELDREGGGLSSFWDAEDVRKAFRAAALQAMHVVGQIQLHRGRS